MHIREINHGFLWILQTEQKYRNVFAASSDYSDAFFRETALCKTNGRDAVNRL